MAAKSILNEFYQRLRTAAPIYRTHTGEGNEGFVCALSLPPVQAECGALNEEVHFQGEGSSKKVRGLCRLQCAGCGAC